MRYILLGVAVFFASYVWAANESVSAISFNPSRTGAYKHLKIIRKATLAGMDACKEESGTCTSTAQVNVETKGTVQVVGDCSGSGNCNKQGITITTITTGNVSGGSVETLTNTLVRGTKQPTEVTPELESLDFATNLPSNIDAMGTRITIHRGGTLESTGKTFMDELAVPSTASTVAVTVESTDDAKAKLNLTKGKPIQVTGSISLGGGKIDLIGGETFEWGTVESNQVLGVY